MQSLIIAKGKKIKINVTVYPGIDATVSEFIWYLDEVVFSNNSYEYILDTSSLSSGIHQVKFEALNSCGKKGNIVLELNIITGDKMEKTINVVVDQPVVQATIVMDFVGNIETIVTDQLNKPVVGALLSLDGTPTNISTGADGKASIPNVPYGTHTVTGKV